MSIDPKQDDSYSMTFTAASLRPELARVVAEVYLDCNDWEEAKKRILRDNSLQARTTASAIRMEREMRQRLQTLSRQQIEILAGATTDSRRAIAWLAILKHSAFVFAFSTGVLRQKIQNFDPVLRPSDYENFFNNESIAHPELGHLAASTKVKIRRVIKTMLREAGILISSSKDDLIRRPIIPPEVQNAIVADNPRWLAGFLVSDKEIAALRG